MKKLIALTILIIYSFTVHSQIIDFKNDKYWLDAGIGEYVSKKTSGFTGNLSANAIINCTLYKISFLHSEEFNLFGPSPNEKYYTLSPMLGIGFSGRFLQLHISSGLGISWGVIRGNLLFTDPPSTGWFSFNLSDPRHYKKEHFISPSIPLELDFLIKPIKYAGLGLSVFGDLNFKRPMFGLVIKMAVGKLR